MSIRSGDGRLVVWAEDAAGLGGRVAVVRLGLDKLPLVVKHVSLVREREHVVGMVAAHRALDAMGILIGQFLRRIELPALTEQPAQQVNRAQGIGMLGLEHSAAIVHVFAEDSLGFVVMAQMDQDRAKAFGRIEGYGVVAPE